MKTQSPIAISKRYNGLKTALLLLLPLLCLIASTPKLSAAWPDITNWKSSAGNGNWNADNWFNNTQGWDNHNPNYEGGRHLQFDNNNQLTMDNNFNGSGTNRWRITFLSGAGSGRTIGGSTTNRFFDSSGTDPRIQNESGGNHVINFPIDGDGDSGDPLEINSTSTGSLTLGGNVNNRGSNINFFGSGSGGVRLNGVISGAGSLFIAPGDSPDSPTVTLNGTNTFTGVDVEVKGGNSTLLIGNNSALSSATLSFAFRTGATTRTLASVDSTARTLTNAINIYNNSVIFGQTSGGTGALTLSGNVFLGNDGSAVTRLLSFNTATTLSGVISGGNNNVLSVTAGSNTVTLSGAGANRATR
jgi:hypothetical protein